MIMEPKSELPEEKPDPPLQIERESGGQLCLIQGDKSVRVIVRPCFPWSQPDRFLSLRSEDGREIALVENIEALPESSRAALETAMAETRFTFKITGIKRIRKDFELRVWEVETTQGARTFETKLDAWPLTLIDGSIVLRDLAGDLYHIPDPGKLDRKSARLLWAFQV